MFGAALPGTFYKRDESLPPEMRYFDGKPPETLRFGSPWPQGKFKWVTETTEIAPGFHLILLKGSGGVDLDVMEMSLAIDTPDGIVLVVGCSHPTIEKIAETARSVTDKPIHLIVGSTHLLPAKPDEIGRTATTLHDDGKVAWIAPAHCTGEPAFAMLRASFGDRYLYAGLGTTLELGPNVTTKAEAGQQQKHAMELEDLVDYRVAQAHQMRDALADGRMRWPGAASSAGGRGHDAALRSSADEADTIKSSRNAYRRRHRLAHPQRAQARAEGIGPCRASTAELNEGDPDAIGHSPRFPPACRRRGAGGHVRRRSIPRR